LLKKGKEGRLKVIAKHGIGVDNIDLEAAREFGIKVVNVPEAVVDAVAEHTIGLIFLLAKNYIKCDKAVRNGYWKIRYEIENIELRNKILGIIGFGRIGRRVAHMAQALGMQVVVYDPYVKVDLPDIKQVELSSLLQTSDFVSIHCPLTKQTRHLLGRNELEKMKKTAYIINTARGEIIDEETLCELIRAGRIAGAALDTIEEEPPNLTNPILSCPNIILTAHTAGLTRESLERTSLLAAYQILQVLKGEIPRNIII
jgi:D-3-phosphoglycerate dehydrogenase